MGRVREKRRVEERRSEKRKSHKKEDADARKGRKVAKHCVFPMTTNLSYRFPIFETSATALCGTTGMYIYIYICMYVYVSVYKCVYINIYIYI